MKQEQEAGWFCYFATEIKRTERNKQVVMSESTKVTKSESEKARSFMGVRRTFAGGGQRRHSVFRFQIADDQCSLKDNFALRKIFVLMSIIILGLSKWSFQWITNFVNYIINIQSYQNTNKIKFHSNSFLSACFSIALQCCKYARMRFHCATVLLVLSICALRGNTADDAM